jgi:hypothetical protein
MRLQFKTRLWGSALTIVAVLAATLIVNPQPAQAAGWDWVTPRAGESAINVRSGRSTTSPIIGVLSAGRWARCTFARCDIKQGTPYACSVSGLLWAQVNWGATTGWMARQCVSIVGTGTATSHP